MIINYRACTSTVPESITMKKCSSFAQSRDLYYRASPGVGAADALERGNGPEVG